MEQAESSLGLQPFDLQDQLGLSVWGEMRFVAWILTRVNLDPSSCPAQAPANVIVTKEVFHGLLPLVPQQLENTIPVKPFSPACSVPHRGEVLLKGQKQTH